MTPSSAERLAAYALVLRALAHRAHGRLAAEPQLEHKRALAAQALEDLMARVALLDRLAELPGGDGLPGAPGDGLADRLATADPAADLKPALARAVREHVAALHPLAEEPTLRLLTGLALAQERHVAELGATGASAPRPLELDVRRGGELLLPSCTAPPRPAREGWVEAGEDPGGLHGALNAALLAGEVAARAAYDLADAPPALRIDLARVAADRLRHAVVLDAELIAAGGHWGDAPVALDGFARALGGGLDERLAFATAPLEGIDDAEPQALAALRADEHALGAIAARWR